MPHSIFAVILTLALLSVATGFTFHAMQLLLQGQTSWPWALQTDFVHGFLNSIWYSQEP